MKPPLKKKYRKQRAYYRRNRAAVVVVQKKYHREWHQRKKLAVMAHYSAAVPFCACCGEKESVFLSIDHIQGGGGAHRKKIFKGKSTGDFYGWLIKNNFPTGFQVLCYNCNMAKHFGKCPHQL